MTSGGKIQPLIGGEAMSVEFTLLFVFITLIVMMQRNNNQ